MADRQTLIFLIPVKDEMRIIRSCGWLPNPESLAGRECFTRTGTHSVIFSDILLSINIGLHIPLSLSRSSVKYEIILISLQLQLLRVIGNVMH